MVVNTAAVAAAITSAVLFLLLFLAPSMPLLNSLTGPNSFSQGYV